MMTETYKGRKLKVKKGREWGTVAATCNGVPVSVAGAGHDQVKALADLRSMIDFIDREPVDGSRWGAEWYAPGTYTMCPEGTHPVALGSQCRHPYCTSLRSRDAAEVSGS